MAQKNAYTGQGADPEEELKLARERFNIIFQHTTVSIWDYRLDTRQIIQPVRSQQLHGFDQVVENVPDSLIENGFVHPDSAQAFREMYAKLFAGEPHAEGVFRVQNASRTGYWYEHIRYNTLFDAQGKPYAAVGMSTDDTAQVEAHLAAERWKTLLSNSLGKEAVVLEFDLTNDVFVQITGAACPPGSVLPQAGFDRFIEAYANTSVLAEDAAQVKQQLHRSRLMTAYLDGSPDLTLEYRMLHQGQVYWIRLSTRLMRHEMDNTLHFYMLHADITRQKEQELALQRKAETDSLTGLLNHHAFWEKAQALWAQRPGQPHILLLLDLDNFKEINDTFGHAEGDNALLRAARCIESALQSSGASAVAARAGGDEFSVLFLDGQRDTAEQFARQLLAQLAEPVVDGLFLSASIGLAVAPDDSATFDGLGVAADRALYYVKHHGKANYCFYADIFTADAGWQHRRQKLLADTLEGGMVGGYLTDGFPFYFVDSALLNWLGYENEAAFVQSIQGLVLNLVHPDDRDYAARMIRQQLAAGGRYEIDCRIKKQDGSYIWVHNIGERMTAPNGQPAITSLCHDISREKERDKLIDQLVDDLEARVALYRVEEQVKLTLLHASENVMEVTHYSDAEYQEICRDDAMDFVYIPDRDLVRSAISKAMTEDTVVTEHFRLCNKKGGFTWVTGIVSRLGSDHGRPVARIIFMPFSIQSDLQLQMLDTEYIGVYVIDQETDELYFANNTILRMYSISDQGLAGKTCHSVLLGKDQPCPNCWRKALPTGKEMILERSGRVFSLETQTREWNGRHILVVYSRDITERFRLQERQQALFDNIPAGISLFSVKQTENGSLIRPVFFSSMIQKVFGIDTERILQEGNSQAFFRCVHPDDLPQLMAALSRDVAAVKTDCCYHYRCWNAHQQAYFWVELRANMVQNGSEILVYATYNDITKAHQLQERLEEKQRTIEAVTHYGNFGIWTYDLDSRELQMASFGKNALGYEEVQPNIPDDFVARKALFPADEQAYLDCYQRILAGAAESECTVRVRTLPSDDYLWMNICLIRQKDTADGKRRALGFSFSVDHELRSVKELEKAKLALQAANERFDQLLNYTDAGIILFALSGGGRQTAEYISQGFCTLWGGTAEAYGQALAQDGFAGMAEEYRGAIRQAYGQALAKQDQFEVTYRTTFPRTDVRWVTMKMVFFRHGGKQKGLATFHDVTEIMEVQQKLQRNQRILQQNQAVLEARINAEQQKARSSRDNTLFYYIANVSKNQVVEYRLPFAREPVTDVPMPLPAFVAAGCRSMGSEADRQQMIARHDANALLAKFRSGVTYEEFDAQFSLTGGVTYWAKHRLSLLQEPTTGDVYLYEYVYDVSQEKIMNLMLRYEMSHGCEAVGFLAVDSGQFISTELQPNAQGQWKKVTTPFAEYIHHYAETAIVPEDREKFLQHYLGRSFAEHERAPAEIVYRCRRGDKLEYLSGTLHSYQEDGRRFCVLARRNVTELIRSEEEKNRQLSDALATAEKASRAKTDFLSRMSHDIRTPLNGVIGMTEIALKENTDPRLQTDLQTIASSGKFLLSLINDILDISRIESGKLHLHPAPLALDSFTNMIDAVICPLMREKNITFECQMCCGLTCIMADEVRFNQIFFNLLSNAAKYTPVGGHVVFSAQALADEGNIEWVQFSIKDNGIGMSPDFLQKAFEPFEQMHDHGYGAQQRQGTGLGLAIVRELVALMGGKITVHSQLGKGSEFLVDLPLEKCALPQSAPAGALALSDSLLAGKRVLLVEDNEINALVATRLLQAKGILVETAAQGQLALERFAQAALGTFDAILMDVRMPVMDGLEATRRIRALPRPDAQTIPIVAMSANAYEEDRQMSFAAGMNEHLSKPVEPDTLYRLLARYIVQKP